VDIFFALLDDFLFTAFAGAAGASDMMKSFVDTHKAK